MGDIFDDIFGAPQRARPTFNQKDKEHLYASQKGKCNECRTKFPLRNLTIDHIKPFSKGGSDKPSNLQLLCGSCNSAKGNGTQVQLKKRLAAKGIIQGPAKAPKKAGKTAVTKKPKKPRNDDPFSLFFG